MPVQTIAHADPASDVSAAAIIGSRRRPGGPSRRSVRIRGDGPLRMVRRWTWSGRERSSHSRL